jgi:peptidoglycan/LPS O-acetylase OafA/YrhL
VRIDADGKSVIPIGKPHFEIASRYDDVAIEFHAAEPPTSEPRDSVVILEPEGTTFAAKVRLRLRVSRPGARTVAAVGGAALAAILLGIPTLWTTLSPTWKATSVAAAALLTAFLANAGLKKA